MDIVYDNISPAFNYTKVFQWNTEEGSQWVGGSNTRFSGTIDDMSTGEFTFTFNGRSLRLFGNVPRDVAPLHVTVELDDQPAFSSPLLHPGSFPNGPYRSWLNLDKIEGPGEHTVRVSGIPPSLSLDYAAVEVRPEDLVLGQTVIMDDIDSDIEWSGSWQSGSPLLWVDDLYKQPETPHPHNFNVHQSLHSDAAVSISFTGTSLSVMGFKNLTAPLELSFALDHGEPEIVLFQPANETLPTSYNYIWWSRDNLSSVDASGARDKHNLRIQYARPSDQVLSIDYVLYTPSFNLARDKPDPRENVAHDPPNAKAIGAGVGGALAVLLIVLFFILFYKGIIRVDFSTWHIPCRRGPRNRK